MTLMKQERPALTAAGKVKRRMNSFSSFYQYYENLGKTETRNKKRLRMKGISSSNSCKSKLKNCLENYIYFDFYRYHICVQC